MITDSKEYISFLKKIQDSGITTYSALPSTEPRFLIDANERKITVPSDFSFLSVRYDHQAETVYFEIDRYFDDVDLSQHTCIVQFVNKDEYGNVSEGYYRVPVMDITTVEGKIIFGWLIESPATKYAGDIEFSVRFYSITNGLLDDDDSLDGGNDNSLEDDLLFATDDSNGNVTIKHYFDDDSNDNVAGDEYGMKFLYNFNTVSSKSTILDTLQVCGTKFSHPSEFEIWVAKITEIVKNIEQAEKSLADKIEETEQHLVDTVDATKDEVANLLALTEQQVELAKQQVVLASEQVPIVKEQVALAAEKVRLAEAQATISSQKAADATQQAAVAKNYSEVAGRYANEAQQARNESEDFAENSEDYALLSQSYAVGGTAVRDGEVIDNSKYYYEQSKSIADNLKG